MENMTRDEIKKMRKDAGLTQEEAARLIGESPRSWFAMEAGRRVLKKGQQELFQIKIRSEATTKSIEGTIVQLIRLGAVLATAPEQICFFKRLEKIVNEREKERES